MTDSPGRRKTRATQATDITCDPDTATGATTPAPPARASPEAAMPATTTAAAPAARARTARRAPLYEPGPHAVAARSYWIGVVARDHVALGVAGGFAQLNHGKAGALERMRGGDGFAYYSPRESHPDGPPLQAFTAIGRVRDGRVYQADAGAGFRPFRLDVAYLPAHDAPVKPLLEALSFIRSKQHWGAAFRFGFVRVPEADFARIAAAMGREMPVDFPSDAAGDSAPGPEAGRACEPRSTRPPRPR